MLKETTQIKADELLTRFQRDNQKEKTNNKIQLSGTMTFIRYSVKRDLSLFTGKYIV